MATDFTIRFKEKYGKLPDAEREALLKQEVENAKATLLKAEMALEDEQKLAGSFKEELYAWTYMTAVQKVPIADIDLEEVELRLLSSLGRVS